MKRERTQKSIPTIPGGFLDNPPIDCPNKVIGYCPNETKYQAIEIVDYVRCQRCKIGHQCYRKKEQDKGKKARIGKVK